MKDKKREVAMQALTGVKLHDAGVKESAGELCSSSSKGKKYINYPRLYLDAKQAPQLSDYEVEDDVIFVVKGKIVSHSKNERQGSPSRESFDIEIREIGCQGKSK